MTTFEDSYQSACRSGLLPGVVLLAASKDGELTSLYRTQHLYLNIGDFEYAKTLGVRSLKPGNHKPIELDTVLALASCTKLMTAISVLQCVERGLLNLDEDVSPILPEVGKYGIITDFDDVAGQPILVKNMKQVTLR